MQSTDQCDSRNTMTLRGPMCAPFQAHQYSFAHKIGSNKSWSAVVPALCVISICVLFTAQDCHLESCRLLLSIPPPVLQYLPNCLHAREHSCKMIKEKNKWTNSSCLILTAFHVHDVIWVSHSSFVELLTPGMALQSPLHNGKLACKLLSWNWRDGGNFHNNLMDLSSSSDKQVCAYFLVDLPINSLVICNILEVPVFDTNWKNSLSSHSDPWHSLCCLLASPWENTGVHWMLWSLMHLCSDGPREQINGPSVENALVWFLINTFPLLMLF